MSRANFKNRTGRRKKVFDNEIVYALNFKLNEVPNMIRTLIFSSLIMLSQFATAKTEATKTENFRCEKMMGTDITQFKSSLLENCNLNMPFSSSVSKILNDETYFYCCHKK